LLPDGSKDWSGIWMVFAIYALFIAVFFGILFRHKHNPAVVEHARH